MASKKDWKVPFDRDGNLISFTYSEYPALPAIHWENSKAVRSGEWRDNYVFHDTLIVEEFRRGRSAAKFLLRSESGQKYEMFMSDMLEMVQKAELIAYGHIEGDWTFAKKGSNYGVKLVK
jgi:hypothetical protein